MNERETMKIRVELTVEIDVAEWREAYGDESKDQIRNDVKYGIADGARAAYADGVVAIELRNR